MNLMGRMERAEKAIAVLAESDAKLRQGRREWALAQVERVMRTLSLSQDEAVGWMRENTPIAYAHLIGEDAPQPIDKRSWAESKLCLVMERLRLDRVNAIAWMREHTPTAARMLI